MATLSKQNTLDEGPRPGTADTVVEEPIPDQGTNQSPKKIEEGTKPSPDDSGDDEKPSKPTSEEEDPFLIKITPEDPRHPWSWSLTRRWFITLVGGILTLNSTFSSAAPSGLVVEQMEEFTFSREVGTLLISLFVAGYCIGPLLWGPLSERYGRRKVFIGAFIPYTLFQMGCALAPNTGSILIFRLLGGAFASAPLSNAGAIMADVFEPKRRGIGMGIFSLAPFAGPALGPTISGFMSVKHVDWRWIYWVMMIFAGVCLVMIFFFLPETYVPYIEHEVCKEKRKKENEPRYHCALEHKKLTKSQKLREILVKPWAMLFQEPMLLAITIYMSFVYGCLYLLFEAFPIIYVQEHGLNIGQQGLCFLSLPVGGSLGVLLYIFVFNPRYEKAIAVHAPKRVPPEKRLEMALIGGPMLVIGFFWIGWTAYPHISIWSPIVGTVPIGLAMIFLFLPLMTYIVDTYLFSAASALAINAVVRSSFGAAFPLFATQMFEKLGVQWASSLLGFFAVALAPIPFLFFKFGPKLRKMSKYSPDI